MKFCPNCGAQLPDNAGFCSNCGTPLGAPPQYQQPPKMSYMDKVRAAREAQKQKQGQIKWWMWALIGIGSALLIALDPLGLGA